MVYPLTAKEESLAISLKCLTCQSACAALNNFCRCLCVLITCWQFDHVTVACLASLYQQCRLSFTDCLLNGGSHFEEAGCVKDYFVGHNVSMVGRYGMSHMQSYAISAALYTMYTARYTYTYIIRKGDHCTCVFFDPFSRTVTDRLSNEACTKVNCRC